MESVRFCLDYWIRRRVWDCNVNSTYAWTRIEVKLQQINYYSFKPCKGIDQCSRGQIYIQPRLGLSFFIKQNYAKIKITIGNKKLYQRLCGKHSPIVVGVENHEIGVLSNTYEVLKCICGLKRATCESMPIVQTIHFCRIYYEVNPLNNYRNQGCIGLSVFSKRLTV